MRKVKVTLSVDDELLRESRAFLAERNLTISGKLEDALEEVTASGMAEKIAAKLGEKLGYVGYDEIPHTRPKGKDAARAIREARYVRSKALSR